MVEKGLRRVGGRGFLDGSDEDDDLYTIHGIAIGAGDVTLGSTSGERKYWSEEVLRESASTLQGKQVVANHENRDIYSVVGSITDAAYSDERNGVVFQGVVDEELLAKRINRGWLDVSPRIIHTEGEVDENGIKHPGKIRTFDNLALVSKGAAQSNEVMIGEAEELSAEEIQSCFDEDPDQYEAEFEQFEELQSGIDYEKHLYEDREGAEGAAQGLGCEGSHKVDFGDKTLYMPCRNRDSFLRTMKGEDEEAEADEEVEEESEEAQENEEEEVEAEESEEVDDIVDEFSEKTKEEYSREEMRIASQMASHSEMTKVECLSFMDLINPSRDTDIPSLANVMDKILSEQQKKGMSEMLKPEKMASDSGKENVLNKLFK